jgi:hypothetical protein
VQLWYKLVKKDNFLWYGMFAACGSLYVDRDRDFVPWEPGKINEDTVYILSQWFRILSASCQNTVVECARKIFFKLDTHVSVHHDIIYENDQQNATV